ncbi:MAG: hypothetical protein JO051_08525 [Acidobacteriaceae bacterium]|nr:hypothetical protein [Acidobacteriaceae bacterium]
MLIFDGLLRYVQTGHSDVKALQGDFEGRLRLRIGDDRLLSSPTEDSLHIHAVRNRKDAYRQRLREEPLLEYSAARLPIAS